MSELKNGVAIHAHNLTKVYPGSSAGSSLRTMALRIARKQPPGPRALDDINLTIETGQAVGIIGRNGSGKSTLLKMLAGILSPTAGSLTVRGRVGTLLDLSSGIHPEYTGAENTLVLGMLAGLSKSEVRSRMPEIRRFSGLGEAFDHPAKTYSSGMSLRLGFSAAIHSDPEILLIDEALAVGDAFFQQRCLARMRRLREEGTTIVLVSHDPSAIISLCDRAIWLEHGRVSVDGTPAEVVKRYLAARYHDDCELDAPLASMATGSQTSNEGNTGPDGESIIRPATPIRDQDDRFGDGRARVVGMEVRNEAGKPISTVGVGERISVVITVECLDRLTMPLIGFTLRNRLGDVVTATNTELEGIHLTQLESGDQLDLAFDFSWPALSSGSFSFSPAIADGNITSHRMCDWLENVWILEAENPRGLFGWMTLDHVSVASGKPRNAPGVANGGSPVISNTSTTGGPARIEFALETPRTTTVAQDRITDDAQLFMAGWCFATSGEPVRLTIWMADEPPRTVTASGFRPDVGKVHAGVPGATRSGFGILVPTSSASGRTPCRIEASVRGQKTTVAELQLDIPAPIRIANPAEKTRPKIRQIEEGRTRILFVSHSLNLEGAPRSLFEMANALDSSRFEKRLVSPTDGPFAKDWTAAGIPVSTLDWDTSISSGEDFDAQVRRLAGLTSVWRPDLIIANTLETFWAVHLAAELGRPSIWIVRESEAPETYFHSRLPTQIAERARLALALTDRIVFVAEATRKLFTHSLIGSKDRLIVNGLDLTHFDLESAVRHRSEIRGALGLPNGTPLLLSVGTSCHRKAQLELIQALGRLRRSRPDFHCVFLGVVEGEYLDSMKRQIRHLGLSHNITLRSPVPDARPHFAAADLTICNSYQESLPRVVLESMAFANPIVATNVFGIPELVRDGIDGLLVEPGDIESLYDAMERLLCDDTLAQALGKSARLRAEEKFSLQECAEGYRALLDELLDHSPRAGR